MTLPPEDRDLIERVLGLQPVAKFEPSNMYWIDGHKLVKLYAVAREDGEDRLRLAIRRQWREDNTCARLDDVRAHIAGLRPGDAEAISLFQQEFIAMKEAAVRAEAAPVVDEVRKIIEGERDHWLKEAVKHRRSNGLRSDYAERDLERARIAERILGKFAALEAALNPSPTGGQDQ